MKLLSLAFFSCVVLVFCSCEKGRKEMSENFPSSKKIRVIEKKELDSVLVRYPCMKIDGSYCCIADYDTQNCFFHLYTYPDFKYLMSFGGKGHSRTELTMLTDFDFKNGVVTALCGADKSFKFFKPLHGSVEDVAVVKYDETLDLSAISDDGNGHLYTYALVGPYRMLVFDYQGTLIDKKLPLPSLKKEEAGLNLNYLYQSVIYSNAELAVYATIAGERMEISRFGSDSVNLILGSLGNPAFHDIHTNGLTVQTLRYSTFVDLFAGKNIYGLYIGGDVNGKDVQEHSVRVYALNGEPIRKYEIPEDVVPTSLYVDEKNNKIYLLVPESEQPIWTCEM